MFHKCMRVSYIHNCMYSVLQAAIAKIFSGLLHQNECGHCVGANPPVRRHPALYNAHDSKTNNKLLGSAAYEHRKKHLQTVRITTIDCISNRLQYRCIRTLKNPFTPSARYSFTMQSGMLLYCFVTSARYLVLITSTVVTCTTYIA